MENKEVEQMLNQIKVEYALLEGKLHYQSKGAEKLLEDNQSLSEQVHELKHQLQAKDKALDKACKTLTEKTYSCPYEAYNIEPRGDCRKYCKDGMESKCWKEWCENGID